MKTKIKVILLLIACAIGGFLIGYNGGRLNVWWNIALYILGLFIVSCSVSQLGILGIKRHKRK